MAQRLGGVATKTRTAAAVPPPVPVEATALDLAPLIAPYRKFGRLSLRVEGLPPRARLSKGHNNGDRSWSLFSDELEGLAYLPAASDNGTATLAIRIVQLDGGDGTTLALLDYPLDPGAAPKPPAPDAAPAIKTRKFEPPVPDPRDDIEAKRFAHAEAQAGLADSQAQRDKERARAEAETARAKSDEAERRRLREEVARLRTAIKEHDAALALALDDARRGQDEAIKRAEAAWHKDEAERLAQARSEWERQSEHKLESRLAQADLARRDVETRQSKAESEIERLKDDLAQANQILADREGDIGELNAQLERAEKTAKEFSRRDSEGDRLRTRIQELEATLAAREQELIKAATALEQARDQWLKQTEHRLAEALAGWKRDEATRALAVENQVQEQAQGALLRLSDKLKHTEHELKEARAQAEALRQRGDADDIRRLRKDYGHLQAVLAERETEIAQLRLDSEHARERWTAEARMHLQAAEQEWRNQAEEEERSRTAGPAWRRNLRDALLVASLAAVGVLAWQRFDITTVTNLWPSADVVLPQAPPPSAPTAVQPKTASVAPAAPSVATLVHGANLRKEPKRDGEVVAVLSRAVKVAELERRGNWVHVRTLDAPAREGWIYSSFLGSQSASK